MNKTKIILISIAAVVALGTAVLAFLTYSAISARSESGEEAEFLETEARRLAGLKVYPGAESVKATEDNRKAYESWRDLALALASAGDQKFEETTPASFKAAINEDAKRIAALPGSIEGRFVRNEFGFGFDEYINKGKLPAAADLPRLQREWSDISTFIAILTDAKASSIVEIQMAKAPEPEEAAPRRTKGKAKAAETATRDITRFDIVFTASPEALIKVLNDIAANPRFIVAESCAFARTPDALSEKLGEKSAKKTEGGRRRRRSETVAEEPAADAEASVGVVTSPEAVEDYKVTMKVAVYDFRTKSGAPAVKEDQE